MKGKKDRDKGIRKSYKVRNKQSQREKKRIEESERRKKRERERERVER